MNEAYNLLPRTELAEVFDIITQPDTPGAKFFLKKFWHSQLYSFPALKFIQKGPVLDVGCGQGDFLLTLRRNGFECVGVEFDQDAVLVAREKGLNVYHADIRTISDYQEKLGGGFPFITLSHVLEHMTDPIKTLKEISSLLSDDGRLIIVVPNARSAMRFLFGRYWHGWDPPFHLIHFKASSLRLAASNAGLRTVSIKTGGTPEDLRRSLNLLTGNKSRLLILRMITLPLFKIFGLFGFGSQIIAVLAKNSIHASPSSARK